MNELDAEDDTPQFDDLDDYKDMTPLKISPDHRKDDFGVDL
jgi:hypothetical protein